MFISQKIGVAQKPIWSMTAIILLTSLIKTFKADAYTRFTLENDSGIVTIAESVSEVYWDREKGPREVIKSKKQTDNLNPIFDTAQNTIHLLQYFL